MNSDDEDEKQLTEEEKKSHKFLHPLEVWEHIKKLWWENVDILDIVFGSIDSTGRVFSTGFKTFFMTNVIVTPNRFWPEMTGGSGGGDRAFLHAHSAMLTRILNAKDSLIKAISAKSKDKTIILDENMNQ